MTLPILRHENWGGAKGELSAPIPPRSPSTIGRGLNGHFRPGLRVIVIHSDGVEKQGIARWGEGKRRRVSEEPGDWPAGPILLLPAPEGPDGRA
jgi:hypothetical protein